MNVATFRFCCSFLVGWLLLATAARAQVSLCAAYTTYNDNVYTSSDDLAELSVKCGTGGLPYNGSSAGFTADGMTSAVACNFSIENNQWIGFTAWTNELMIDLAVPSCGTGQGLELLLLAIDCDGTLSAPLACESILSNNSLALVVEDLLIGQAYVLLIDGIDGAVCDFSVAVLPDGQPPALVFSSVPVGPTAFCTGDTLSYSIAPLAANAAFRYEWQVDGGAGVNFIGATDSTTVRFVVTDIPNSLDIVTVTAKASTACNSATSPPAIAVESGTIVTPPQPIPFCLGQSVEWQDSIWDSPVPGQSLEVTYDSFTGCDSTVKGILIPMIPPIVDLGVIDCCLSTGNCPPEGFTQIVYPGAGFNGCDSTEIFSVFHLPLIPPTELGTIVLDTAEAFIFNGTTYTSDDIGVYSVQLTSYQGCDSLVNFTIDGATSVVNDDPQNHWSVYPNPAGGTLRIRIDEALPPGTPLLVYDHLGIIRQRASINTGVNALDLSRLPVGTYLLSYTTAAGGRRAQRLVIQ